LKPKCEESLSNFAFDCDLRHYTEAYTSQAAEPSCTRARRVGTGGGMLELSWVGEDFGSTAAVGSCAELEDAIARSPGALVVATLSSKDSAAVLVGRCRLIPG